MHAELRKAWRRAGIKGGGGLLVLAGLVGVRLVTAPPDGLEADLAELEAAEAELRAEAASEPGSEDAGAGVDAAAPGAPSPRTGADRMPSGSDPDRLVSCRLGGSLQFTRAADCLARGGASRDLPAPD